MFSKTFPVGPLQCNCTILGCEESGEAIVIDPGDEVDRITEVLQSHSLTVKQILHTHAHFDHIGATSKLRDETQSKTALHKDDLFLYENYDQQVALFGLTAKVDLKPIDHFLCHGDTICFGKGRRLDVIHTPGHTPGSLTFRLLPGDNDREFLFTGDTLFLGSIGRTDLWGGDFKEIIDSIKTKILPLDDKLLVIPGHGPTTTIGQERQSNPFLVGT